MSQRRTISNCRHREGLKPFHVIPKPLKPETHMSDRLWLCDWLKDWTTEDFFYLMNFMFGLSAGQIIGMIEFEQRRSKIS